MIVDVVDALDAALKHAATGVNATLAAQHPSATALRRIYSSWDVPPRGQVPELPSLAAVLARSVPGEAGQAARDSRHEFEFWYVSGDVTKADRRKNVAWVLDALLRTIQPAAVSPEARIGGGVQEVELRDAAILFGYVERNLEYVRLLRATLVARDTL